MGASGNLGAKLSQGSWETSQWVWGEDIWLKKKKSSCTCPKHILWQVNEIQFGHFGHFPHNFSFHWTPVTGKHWTKSQSTFCSCALPIPNELTFSTAFLCYTLRHFSLNKLFSGISMALFYLHWLLGTTFSLLLISLGDLQLQMKHRPIVH